MPNIKIQKQGSLFRFEKNNKLSEQSRERGTGFRK